nr:unnamed protein product [Callosobruchus chinensis]
MDRNRPLTQKELEEIADHFFDDKDYCDSEFDGDNDAEDFLPLQNLSSSKNAQLLPSKDADIQPDTSTGRVLRKTMLLKHSEVNDYSEDENVDDSDADPDFYPNDETKSTKKLARWFPSDSPTSSKDEEQTVPPSSGKTSWSKKVDQVLKFQTYNFTECAQVNITVNSDRPIDYFKVYFNNNICKMIIDESNLYATQQNTQLCLTTEELDAFLGILIVLGFHSLPTMRSYWSTNENFHVERVSKVFSLKRFLKITRYLHINNNEKMPQPGTPSFDKLYKLRPLIDHLTSVFQTAFTPYRHLSVDESMCAFKGRTTLKQYMPMKPIKRGFKIWALACATTGYLLNFQIYQGKAESTCDTLGERVIIDLTENIKNRGYCLYFDNFFTTIPLMQKLLDRGLFGCGTLRQNRKHFPKQFLCGDKDLSQSESDSVASNDVSVYKWKDRGTKCVVLATGIITKVPHMFYEPIR